MKQVRVGLMGSGFIAELHMHAYRRVFGVEASVRAVVSRGDHVVDFARRFGIPQTYRDYRALLEDPDIDVVDICTPPALHSEMIVASMRAGKHVICEKPLTGYFGRPGDPTPIGRYVPKSVMYDRVLAEMDETREAIRASGRLFLYAEDWIYAPAISKTAEILKATKDKILFMKAEESHSGSHAAHAAQWSMTGGGSLIRMGCHPLSAVIYLKQVEARARGERIAVTAVTADVGIAGERLHARGQHLAHRILVDDVMLRFNRFVRMHAHHRARIRPGHAGMRGRLEVGDDLVAGNCLVGCRGEQGSGRGDVQERTDLRVDLLDPGQVRIGHLARGDLAVPDRRGDPGGAHPE